MKQIILTINQGGFMKANIYDVEVFVGDFFLGQRWDFKVVAATVREARRLAVQIGENEGLLSRYKIRRTDVTERETVYTGV